MTPEYEVFALKYAQHARTAAANFLGGDAHDAPMALDYFVWLVRRGDAAWVVDTGFGPRSAAARQRELIRSPAESLALLDVAAETVRDVVLTHMHYDHAGNCALFPAATFHLQDSEMHFTTGRHMAERRFSEGYSVFDVLRLVEYVHDGRVRFHDGDSELAPGLSLHWVGGHTMGLQVVRVHTRRGWVVLASDACHYYRNMAEARPYPVVFDEPQMRSGWARLMALASSPAHVIPGHDPAVMARYPAAGEGLQGIAAALHLSPTA